MTTQNKADAGGTVPPKPDLTVSLHGPGVTIEDAMKVGVATKALLGDIGRSIGADVDWSIVSIQFQCDGCGLKRPDRPGPDEGWTCVDGNDYCPACTTQLGRQP